MSVKIAPSILSADFGRLAEQVQEAERAGADWIHVDVMDGHFVPNLTLGPVVVEAVRRATDLPLDVHLMIERPDAYLADFAGAGADVLTVHQEACPHLHRTLDHAREVGARPGVAVNPATSLSTLEEAFALVDLVLVMSVNPGFGGQAFIEGSAARVSRARAMLDGAGRPDAVVEVDGGVDATNAARLVRAGAGVLVAGSAIYRHTDGVEAGLRSVAEPARAAVNGP